MNALTVLSVAALAACSTGQLLNYPGIYGFSGLLPAAAPYSLKTVAHTPYTLNAVAPTHLPYNVAPFAPVAPVQTQYHAQDELGQYSFGYAGGPSSRAETRDVFGTVRGSYNYVDSDGKIQTQSYVADALGFRVSGTNLPVAPVAAPLALPGPIPEPVEETPEVAAATAAHLTAYNEAAAAAAAAPDRNKRSVVAVAPHVGTYSPLRFSYGFSTPLAYTHPAVVGSPLQYTATAAHPAIATYAHAAHPAIATYAHAAHPAIATYAAAGVPAVTAYTAATAVPRNAELLRVVHNPNHAVSYRVD